MRIARLTAGTCLRAACLSMALMTGSAAQVPPIIERIGAEFQANRIVRYSQKEPSVAGLSNGNFVVAWQDDSGTRPDTGFAVRARLFDPNGIAISTKDFLVPNRYDLSQWQAQAVGLADSFVLGWADNGSNGGDQDGNAVRGRRFNNDGTPIAPQFTINRVTGGDQYEPALARIPTGGFVAGWFDGCFCDGDDGYQVRVQVFNEAGARVGPEFRANDVADGSQVAPAVAGLTNGKSVIVWEDGHFLTFEEDPDIGTVIRGQLIGANGRPEGDNFLVNTTVRGAQQHPSVGALSEGRYVVVWGDEDECCEFDRNIRGRVRNATGRFGAEFVINKTTEGDQYYPKVLGLGGDRFVVCWVDTSQSRGDHSGNAIRCQAYEMNRARATKHGGEFVANKRTTNDQGNEFGFQGSFSLALLANGDFVVVWEDWSGSRPDPQGAGIRGQVFRVN